jgi:hypothetical protein
MLYNHKCKYPFSPSNYGEYCYDFVYVGVSPSKAHKLQSDATAHCKEDTN